MAHAYTETKAAVFSFRTFFLKGCVGRKVSLLAQPSGYASSPLLRMSWDYQFTLSIKHTMKKPFETREKHHSSPRAPLSISFRASAVNDHPLCSLRKRSDFQSTILSTTNKRSVRNPCFNNFDCNDCAHDNRTSKVEWFARNRSSHGLAR